MPVRHRGNRRHLGNQTDGVEGPDFLVMDFLGLWVKRGQRADGGQEHAHRVSVVAEALDEALDVLVNEGVQGDFADPAAQLLLVGQLAFEQQVRAL